MIARLCLVLAVILAVAFLIRLAAVLPIDVDPRVGWHYDMTWYDGVARRLLRGWGYVDPTGVPTAAWPPGYPLLLVAVYSVFGPSVLVAKIANVLLGTATVLLTHLIACQLGRPGVGLVAAAIVAFPGSCSCRCSCPEHDGGYSSSAAAACTCRSCRCSR